MTTPRHASIELATQSDFEPLGMVLGSLLRWSWLVALLGAAAGGGSWLLASRDNDESVSASSRLGLTEATVWPFYDVELEAAQTILNSADFELELESLVGAELDVASERPELLSILDIVVTADDRSTAVEGTDRAAELMVSRSLDGPAFERDAELQRLDLVIGDLEEQIATIRADLDGVIAELVVVTTERAAADTAELRTREFLLTTERDSLARVLDDRTRDMAGRVNDRRTAELSTPRQVLRVVRPTSADSDEPDASRALAIGVGAAAVLVSATAVVLLDRRRGRIRSLWQLSRIGGAQTALGLSSASGSGSISGIGELADRLYDFAGDCARVVGVIDSTASGINTEALALLLSDEGLPTAVVDRPLCSPQARISLIDLTAEYASPVASRRQSRDCDGMLLLVDAKTGIRNAAGLVDRASASAGLVAAVLVSGP